MKAESREFGRLFSEPTRNGLNRPKAVRGSGVKMINMGEIFAYSRLSNVPMDRVSIDSEDRDKVILVEGDLLFARQSLVLEGAGKCSIFLGDVESVTFESHIIRVRLDEKQCVPLFYFYYFQSPRGKAAIYSIVEQGAGASGIRGSDLARLLVDWYPTSYQNGVANILDSIDKKIEINRIIATGHEDILRAIFRSWFVDFDPVKSKAAGAKSFPSMPQSVFDALPAGFVDSEIGLIPESWVVSELGDIAREKRVGVHPSNILKSTPYIGLEHMPRRSIALSEWGQSGSVSSNKASFSSGDILFGKLRPYFHKVGVAAIDGVCSTDIVVLQPAYPPWFGFVLGLVSSDEFVAHTAACSGGTKMPRTNWRDMARYKVCLPPEVMAEAVTGIFSPFVQSIISNTFESKKLAKMRDYLLPKLLTGEVGLSSVEPEIQG